MRTISISSFLVFAALAACSPYSPSLPAEPFLCGTEDPKCPDNFSCQDGGGGRMVCVPANGVVIDSAPDGNHCADDSNLEPNDDIMHAYQTAITGAQGAPLSIPYAGLSICPAGDKDTYSVTLATALENLEAVTVYEAGGSTLASSILNSGGAPIVNSSPMGPDTIRSYAPNLPAGVYYIQVSGPSGGTNNYKLTITVTTM